MLEALQAAPDFEIAGVVRRAGAENRPAELSEYPVVKNIKELEGVDVAILCTPTRSVETYAKEILALGINTVDSFDIHTGIVDLRRTLSASAKKNIMQFLLFLQVGIQEAILSYVPCWKLLLRKELLIQTLVLE